MTNQPWRHPAKPAVGEADGRRSGRARREPLRLERRTIGVGLHIGPVVVGSVGADDFLDFTVLGRINQADRQLFS
ncbi:MAG: hypothetical protein Q8O67_17290 [Deltaproteobacteria bacterium]|nr:hypothetical protein [Deltaproteobacteria bacterium]